MSPSAVAGLVRVFLLGRCLKHRPAPGELPGLPRLSLGSVPIRKYKSPGLSYLQPHTEVIKLVDCTTEGNHLTDKDDAKCIRLYRSLVCYLFWPLEAVFTDKRIEFPQFYLQP